MLINILRYGTAVLLVGAWLAPAFCQDSQQYYKKPETTAEFWRAMKHEIELGDFKLAATYLKGFIDKNPSDDELLAMQEQEGNSAFLRLLTIPELRDAAKPLVERVNQVVQDHLKNRKRLDKLVNALNGEPDERDYAVAQLHRAGAVAMPAIIDALIRSADHRDLHASILYVLPRMGQDVRAPLLAALDINDPNLKLELMDVLQQRGDKDAVPYLWYIASSPKQSDIVRNKARQTLGMLLDSHPDRVPQAKVALTALADQYYRHQVSFPDPAAVTVWRWDGKELVSQTMPAVQAEEYYGLRFARQALDLDPAYTPAQIVFLSLVLDKGIHKPGARELLRSSNPELVMAVLDRALHERQVAVILAAAAALGDQAEVRAVRPNRAGGVPVLLRALDYPDRRVQMVAADAILRIPAPPAAPANTRVIDVLRGALAGDPLTKEKSKGRVLVAFSNPRLANQVGAAVERAGYEAVVVTTGRAALQRLNEANDIDILLIDASLPNPGLPTLLAQLRAHLVVGTLPLLIATPSGLEYNVNPIIEKYEAAQQAIPEQAVERRQSGRPAPESSASLTRRYAEESAHAEAALTRSAGRYRNVTVIPLEQAVVGRSVAVVLERQTAEPASKPLSEGERHEGTAKAIEWLARLARGEVSGYDIQPAEAAILKAFDSKDFAGLAVEAAAGLRGHTVQRELSHVVLDNARPEDLRSAAAIELCRQIQRNGLGLTDVQAKGIEKLYDSLPDDKLKTNIALVLGALHPDARQTGLRLEGYTPKPPAPPKPAAPAPKKEDKDKDDSDK